MRFSTKDVTCLLFILLIVLFFTFFSKFPKITDDDETDPIQRKINQLRIKVSETEGLSKDHWNDVRLLKEQLQLLLKANLKLNYSNGVNVPVKLQQFLSNISAIASNDIQHPGIYHYLPHIIGKPQALRPSFTLSRNRQSVSIVAGIPTIKRERESYLIRTLSSLLENSNEEEQDDCLFIVFVAEPWDLNYVKEVARSVEQHFPAAVEKGLIEVISPPPEFYPNLDSLQETFGDSKERVKWRTKQNLDFSFLMLYARNKASYYMQLEDDIITKYSYLSLIKSFAINQKTPPEWVMLEFSYLGFIGKLFKSTDLPLVVEFFLMFYKDKPIDWLLDHLLSVKVCNPEKDAKHCRKDIEQVRRRYKPSLFQHIGTHSSLKGKVQKLKDKDFGKPQLHKGHRNPHAELSTSLKTYQKFSLERAYIGETFFWAFTPTAGDYITIKFTPPIFIEKFLFRSGNSEHPGDRFFNTTIELLPEKEAVNPTFKYLRTPDNYLIAANFTLGGEASANLHPTVPKIHTMRLMTHSNGTSWVILNEINIVQKKAP